jgi:hypothetical protein
VSESEGSALAPNAGVVAVGESGESVVRAGRAVAKIASQAGQFLLCRGVFRSRGIKSRRSGVGLTTGLTRGRLRMRSLFLLVPSALAEGVKSADEK